MKVNYQPRFQRGWFSGRVVKASFNGKHYLQIRGTAICTKMAPSYANVFMGGIETKLFEQAPVKPVFFGVDLLTMFFSFGRTGRKVLRNLWHS